MAKQISQFERNYDGILTHNGEIRVAKGGVYQKILHIGDDDTILVKNSKGKGYHADIHFKLLQEMLYVNKGDLAIIKFNNNRPYMVGFKKRVEQDDRRNLELFVDNRT